MLTALFRILLPVADANTAVAAYGVEVIHIHIPASFFELPSQDMVHACEPTRLLGSGVGEIFSG